MGGSSIDDDWEFTTSSNELLTVVLVGRTGNGKSAIGDSILGRKAFKSKASSSGVTSTCEMQRTVLRDGRVVNVIDTHGLFDFSVGSVKCIKLAKDGIHAVLVAFSVRTHFSKGEEAAIQSLQTLFGDKIIDYMIVVFTSGDELEDNNETMEDYLGRECLEPLQFYVVSVGRRSGIYSSWIECHKLVSDFIGASYRFYATFDEAQTAYMTWLSTHQMREAVPLTHASFTTSSSSSSITKKGKEKCVVEVEVNIDTKKAKDDVGRFDKMFKLKLNIS